MTHSVAQPFIDFLSQYTTIKDEEKRAIIKRTHYGSYKKNEFIQRQGEIPKRVAFINKGAARMFYIDKSGKDHTTAFTFENHPIVALDSFTQQIPLAVNTIALEPAEMIWTSNSEFYEVISLFPKFEAVLLMVLSKFLAVEGEQAKLLRIHSSRERYEALCKMRPEVIQRVPVKYIASYLGMADETLSRVRAGKL